VILCTKRLFAGLLATSVLPVRPDQQDRCNPDNTPAVRRYIAENHEKRHDATNREKWYNPYTLWRGTERREAVPCRTEATDGPKQNQPTRPSAAWPYPVVAQANLRLSRGCRRG